MEKKRRYPVGKHLEYDRHLNRKKARSLENDNGEYSQRTGRQFSIDNITDLVGLKENYTEQSWYLDEDIELMKVKYINQKQAQINKGKRFKLEKTRKDFELEAGFDFLDNELIWINKHINKLQKEDHKAEDQNRLRKIKSVQLGSIESISYVTGKGHISYQKVAPLNGNGLVTIIDKMSPYNGMSLLDFREFIIPLYNLEVNKIYEKRLKLWEDNGKEGHGPSLRKIKPPWPRWPKGITNHFKAK